MIKNKDIVFLGGLFPKNMEQDILKNSKGGVQNAANSLQWNLVTGLDKNLHNPVKIINSLYIGSYPKLYKKIFIKTNEFKHHEDSQDINIGFLNIWGIKNIIRYYKLKPYLKEWSIDNVKKDKVVIAYAMTSTFCRSIKYIKKKNENIKTVLVVPDLPQYMNTSKNNSLIYKIFKKFEIINIEKNKKYIDSFVFLTEYMSKEVNTFNKPYTIIEGIATNIEENKYKIMDVNRIVYTGTLNERYGIKILIDAFIKINKENYELVICGKGDSEGYIIENAKKDTRIKYLGSVSREKSIDIQRTAKVLINPRQDNEEFTKYSFPSKIMEYLSTGIPVIAYELKGIPKEYKKHIYYVEGNTVDDLKKMIINTCELESDILIKKGLEARKFVMESKNDLNQTKKIIKMIEEI